MISCDECKKRLEKKDICTIEVGIWGEDGCITEKKVSGEFCYKCAERKVNNAKWSK